MDGDVASIIRQALPGADLHVLQVFLEARPRDAPLGVRLQAVERRLPAGAYTRSHFRST